MNLALLYLLLLKGTVTAFAGLASLPVIQEALRTVGTEAKGGRKLWSRNQIQGADRRFWNIGAT